MKHASKIVAISLLAFTAQAADVPSEAFKASIDAAMAANDGSTRARLLVDALDKGSDKEVFFIFPALFPAQVLDGATRSGVCTRELAASLELISTFQSGDENPEVFAKEHSSQIRAATDNVITCLHQYYKDGQLTFPGGQSNKSFKPKPLRGSA